MPIIKRTFNLIKALQKQTLFYSTATVHGGFHYIPKFNGDDEKKILDILNGSNAEQMTKFDVSLMRIKRLENYKNKKGPFKSLTEILEVDGLGVKNLEKLCESIMLETQIIDNENVAIQTNKMINGALNKNRRNFLTPNLPNNLASTLTSAVGLHLDPMGISWAKLCCDNNQLSNWNFFDFSNLPKKMMPTETFDLAMSILEKIPTGDVYVLEAPMTVGPVGQKQSIAVNYTQNLELTSMLLALINTSTKHSLDLSQEQKSNNNNANKVYMIKSKLPARLFKTLVGNEKVSSSSNIDNLLSNLKEDLPCTKINTEDSIKDFYYLQSTVHKEILGQALLLTISFMDLCVYKNEISINILTGRKKK